MKTTKRNLIIFVTITLASGWIGVLVDSILTEQPAGNSLGMGIWLILPFFTTIVLRIMSKDKKDIGLKPNVRKNGKWYFVSIAIYPVITAVVISIGFIWNCVNYSDFILSDFISLAFFSILANLVKNFFEEFSWRGYLTPKLIELKFGDWCKYHFFRNRFET